LVHAIDHILNASKRIDKEEISVTKDKTSSI